MSSETTIPVGESETVELKKSLAELKQGLISMVAMLNKHGAGELWFGVAPDGRVVGLDANEKTLRDVSQAIGAHIEPRCYPHIEIVHAGRKSCLRITFRGQDAPYFASGRAYMRVADEDRQLSARELENLILHKNKEALRWDNQPCEAGTLAPDALDTAKIQRFVEKAELTWDNPDNALDKLELRKNGQPLNAVKLFFARRPPLQLRCAVFATTDSATIIDRHDFDGDILELVEEAQKYILKNIHIGMRLEGLYRVDVPEISMAALREAIINAFCHRDYRDPDYVQVAIFKNRVEIRNPGGLYDGLTMEEMRGGNVSRRRNPLIADLFRRIHMVEGWGRGMPLILENAPSVQFRQIAGLFIASFERPSFLEEGTQETVDKTVEKTVEKLDLTGKEKALCALVRQDPDITQKNMAIKLDISERGVRYLTDKLQKQQILQRVGGKKAGRWVLTDSANAGKGRG
ncbi:MAG: ATP-binding protein [Desulfuromonadales bacterium]